MGATIVVAVKYVPDPDDPVELTDDLRVDRSHGMLSSLDEYAVDQAVRLRRKGETRVVALTMGPAAARSAVTRALQMGADAATTARVLAAAIALVGDVLLVVTGMSSTDAGTGTVPAMLADVLGWSRALHARSVELDERRVVVRRDDPDGVRTLAARLPALVSVTDQAGEPTYPSFAGILAAKRRPVRTLTLADLGLAAPAPSAVRVLSAGPAPARPPARVVTDHAGSGAAALVEALRARTGVAS
jgi:electron transfer flavoprotein beta subunit